MMAAIKSANTSPELVVRRALHKAGFRFRLHKRDLPGRPDIVLPKHRAVVFVNGCFWHGHDQCSLYRLPKSRSEFWEAKISGNKARDTRDILELENWGWKPIVVWECAVKGKGRLDSEKLACRLSEAIQTTHNSVVHVRGTELPQKV